MELYNKEELLEYAKACNLSDVADRALMAILRLSDTEKEMGLNPSLDFSKIQIKIQDSRTKYRKLLNALEEKFYDTFKGFKEDLDKSKMIVEKFELYTNRSASKGNYVYDNYLNIKIRDKDGHLNIINTLIQSSGDKLACCIGRTRNCSNSELGSICEKYFQVIPEILFKPEFIYL